MVLGQNVKSRPVTYRQATADQLAEENPVLPVGQIAREKDTGRHKVGDGVTEYNELAAFAGDSVPVVKTGVSGATSIDCSEGSVFILNLTGNVTGFTFTNLVDGKQLEVHFVQDATGSRTLAVNSSVVKLAGGALTLTTTANKVDVLRFRTVSTVVRENGRSLNS